MSLKSSKHKNVTFYKTKMWFHLWLLYGRKGKGKEHLEWVLHQTRKFVSWYLPRKSPSAISHPKGWLSDQMPKVVGLRSHYKMLTHQRKCSGGCNIKPCCQQCSGRKRRRPTVLEQLHRLHPTKSWKQVRKTGRGGQKSGSCRRLVRDLWFQYVVPQRTESHLEPTI